MMLAVSGARHQPRDTILPPCRHRNTWGNDGDTERFPQFIRQIAVRARLPEETPCGALSWQEISLTGSRNTVVRTRWMPE